MRWSESFIPTLRDDPADAEAISHRLMLRAGLIRPLSAGVYSYLPLAWRTLRKIQGIVREEMDGIGGQEFALPSLLPAEPWKESGRWDQVGDELFRLRDRKNAEMCLGMTHEEIFTTIARGELRSYRDLPQVWYQIQAKFRDEPRPKSGVLRGRQFIMKDSYSFDLDTDGLDRAFERHAAAYGRIYERCGISVFPVEAYSGMMGGGESVEFMALCDSGEDWVVTCGGCDYAANLEKARSLLVGVSDPDEVDAPEKFPTPGVKTIADLVDFPGGAPADRQIKTLVYMVRGEPQLFLLRGDHELNEVKLEAATGGVDARPAHPDEIKAALGASAGSLGAVAVRDLPVFADEALRGRRGMTTGANEDGYHLRNVDVTRDIPEPRWVDLRTVEAGDTCSVCGGTLEVAKGIEMGHIFKLGTRYSASMGAHVLGADGEEVPIVMGSYGIGIDRVMAAAIEAHCDDDGICWPLAIAPFHVVIVPVKASDPAQQEVADRLYGELRAAGLEVLLDDRDERAGVKFKDSDLIGIPYRVVLGPRGLKNGQVELFERSTRETNEVPLDDLVSELARRVGG